MKLRRELPVVPVKHTKAINNRKKPLLGAHVSAAGGLFRSIAKAEELGAEVIQIFGASPRQWTVKLPSAAEVEKYRSALRKSNIRAVYLHAAYLVNLASADDQLYRKSVDNLSAHLRIARVIGAQGLIFHLGSSGDPDKYHVLNRIVRGMQIVLRNVPGITPLLMENSSGGGGKIGTSPEELGWLLQNAQSRRIRTCLDTAHAYEAGELSFDTAGIRDFLKRWRRHVGLRNLTVLHANDSKTSFGSGVDRHENIGRGHIGLGGFRRLAEVRDLWSADWILEVPGFENSGPDKKNLDALRSCFK